MKKIIPQTARNLEIEYAGLAIECGTLGVLLDALHVGVVFVMPLTRTVQRGTLAVYQYVVHITARPYATSPIHFATFRAAEVGISSTGAVLSVPYRQPGDPVTLQSEALRLQRELQSCLVYLLEADYHVSKIIAPSRYRLPDQWVWSSAATDRRIACKEQGWQLLR